MMHVDFETTPVLGAKRQLARHLENVEMAIFRRREASWAAMQRRAPNGHTGRYADASGGRMRIGFLRRETARLL